MSNTGVESGGSGRPTSFSKCLTCDQIKREKGVAYLKVGSEEYRAYGKDVLQQIVYWCVFYDDSYTSTPDPEDRWNTIKTFKKSKHILEQVKHRSATVSTLSVYVLQKKDLPIGSFNRLPYERFFHELVEEGYILYQEQPFKLSFFFELCRQELQRWDEKDIDTLVEKFSTGREGERRVNAHPFDVMRLLREDVLFYGHCDLLVCANQGHIYVSESDHFNSTLTDAKIIFRDAQQLPTQIPVPTYVTECFEFQGHRPMSNSKARFVLGIRRYFTSYLGSRRVSVVKTLWSYFQRQGWVITLPLPAVGGMCERLQKTFPGIHFTNKDGRTEITLPSGKAHQEGQYQEGSSDR